MRIQYICRDCGRPAKPAVFYKKDEFVNIPVCVECHNIRREKKMGAE